MEAEIGKEGTALSFALPVFFFFFLVSPHTVVEKSGGEKAVISWKQILCHTDGSVSLFKWDAEPLSAVVLLVYRP